MQKAVVRVRTSERKDYARCVQKWYWAYVLGLKPKVTGPALKFGDLIHQALAERYPPGIKRGPHPAAVFKKLWKIHGGVIGQIWDDEDEKHDAYELGIEMLNNYILKYGKDERYEVIAPEMAFQVEIFDSENDDHLCTYVGQLDATVRDLQTMKIGFFEHKTAKALPAPYWLETDEQAGSYWTYGTDYLWQQGILGLDEDVDFVLYNFLRKGKADEREQDEEGYYLNQNGSRSKRQGSPLFSREWVYRTVAARENLRRRVEWQVTEMQWVREGKLPILKTFDESCRWQCQFKDMCELHELGQDWEAFRDGMYTQGWNPYEAHEPVVVEEQR